MSLVALFVGLAAFAALTLAGTPEGSSGLAGRRIKSVTTTRSRCASRCRGPERTERRISIVGRPADPAAEPDLLERAVDNDGGVLVIRFLVALSTALTTAATLARLFGRRDPDSPPDSELGAERRRDDRGGGGGEAEPPDPTGAEREERDAQMHEHPVSKQELLKALVRKHPKIRIVVEPGVEPPEAPQTFSRPRRRAGS